ncbi:MAG TPA: OmpA family protein [Gemmatimonadaceae bacterium]
MTTSLIDSLKGVASPELAARLATSLGEPTQNVATGLSGGMSAMLLGILNKSNDSGAMQQIFSSVTNSANDGRVLDDPSALVGSPANSPIASLGRQFQTSIFGSRAAAANDVLARHSGMRLGSIASLMQLASPLLLAVLGKRTRESNLNLDSFTRLFTDERDSIQHAAPPGLQAALGTEQRAGEPERVYETVERDTYVREPARSTYAKEPEPTRGNRWLWPTVAAVAALALLWGVSRRREPEMAYRDTTRVSGGEVAPVIVAPTPPNTTTTPSTTTPPMAGAPAGKIQLRGGRTLDVAEGSSEARLVGVLTNPAASPEDTTWFAFDQIQFEPNSAKPRPESSAQIDRIAEILKAYPNATVRIAGFSDNTGDMAANRKLSKERADAARMLIVKKGVPSSHIMSAMPSKADTTMGAMQPQAIRLLVVKKS